jgi:hypothetical protein
VNLSAPRAPVNFLLPPTTRALPWNETLSAVLSLAQACPPRIASRSEPRAPLIVALPSNVTHVGLVKVPSPDPLSVLLPIGRPRPDIVPTPAAFLPLAYPEPVPEYEAVKVWV